MENLEKYNNAFVQVFGAKAEELNDNYGKENDSQTVITEELEQNSNKPAEQCVQRVEN